MQLPENPETPAIPDNTALPEQGTPPAQSPPPAQRSSPDEGARPGGAAPSDQAAPERLAPDGKPYRSKANPQGMFDPHPPRRTRPGMTMHPRKVKSGVRVKWAGANEPESPIARRLLELASRMAAPEDFAEGMDYARRGQIVSAEVAGVLASASIQGRADRAYSTSLQFSIIPSDVWEAASVQMAGEAIYTAGLLAGEISDRVDALFAGVERPLVPTAEDVRVNCTCGHSAGWCKHACTLMAVVADRVQERAFLLCELRGSTGEGLLDLIRERGDAEEPSAVPTPVYEAHVPEAPSARGLPLAECLDRYWDAGPELDTIPTPIEPPAISHPLLRRLGPSPFKEWRFPLLGLLATCYDVIGEANLDREDEAAEDEG